MTYGFLRISESAEKSERKDAARKSRTRLKITFESSLQYQSPPVIVVLYVHGFTAKHEVLIANAVGLENK